MDYWILKSAICSYDYAERNTPTSVDQTTETVKLFCKRSYRLLMERDGKNKPLDAEIRTMDRVRVVLTNRSTAHIYMPNLKVWKDIQATYPGVTLLEETHYLYNENSKGTWVLNDWSYVFNPDTGRTTTTVVVLGEWDYYKRVNITKNATRIIYT